jgi:CobQ-like glutamine amidotransferase family enzyme
MHGSLLPKNPWLTDRLIQEALRHAGHEGELSPLDDELESTAFSSVAGRVRSRG